MTMPNQLRFERADKRTWSLVDGNDKVLGSLVKPSWFSQRVELTTASGLFEVKRLKPLSMAIGLFFGDMPLRVARSKWRGVEVNGPDGQLLYRLLRKSIFSSVHRILDAEGRERYTIKSRVRWSRFTWDHELQHTGGDAFEPLDLLFLLQVIIIQQERAAAAAAA